MPTISRRVLGLLLSALLLLPLIGAFARDLIAVPLLYASRLAGLLYGTIPQALLWTLLLVGALLVAWGNLGSRRSQAIVPPPPQQPGPVARWAQLIGNARHDDYARWRLAHQLGRLTLESLAMRLRRTPTEIRQQLEREEIDAPGMSPQMRDYLRAGLISYNPFESSRRGRRGWVRGSAAPLHFEPAEVVALLETLRDM